MAPMIISASRRTDIPAFFSDWLIKRIEQKYAYVRNPMNFHQVSRIDLSPDVIDCIVFWSKNPEPMIPKLRALEKYMYYFQFTLNAYGDDLERNLPPLGSRIDTFKKLSRLIGRQRVIWRYDPVIIHSRYTVEWHIAKFAQMAEQLTPFTEKCTISFIDMYPHILKNMRNLGIEPLRESDKLTLAKAFSLTAQANQIALDTCAEDIDLSSLGIGHARCIDAGLIEKLTGSPLNVQKDKNQRPECGCASSVDLGLYNTCQNGCLYCYANRSPEARKRNLQAYDVNSPLLCSRITEGDKITERSATRKGGRT